MNANCHTGSVLLIALLLAVAAPAFALEGVGVLAGVDRSQLSGDQPQDFRFEKGTGYTFGAVVEFALTSEVKLSIQPSYLRSSTNINYKDQQAGVMRDSLVMDIDWIVLPVLARIMSKSGTLYATGGLDFAWAIGGGISDGVTEEPVDSFIRDVNVSAIIGVGLEFEVGRNSILAELRYGQGLLNAARDDADLDESTVPSRFRFAGLQLLAGFLFGGGGQ